MSGSRGATRPAAFSGIRDSSRTHQHTHRRGRTRPRASIRERLDEATIASAAQSSSMLSSPNGDVEINDGVFNATAGHHFNITINASGREENRSNGTDSGFPHEASNSQANLENSATVSIAKSCDIYYRHLAPKGRGSPLWIPGPNRRLPMEYQRSGVRIGDVGIITSRGGFDFLFNICLPAGHPINRNKVPENFSPLAIDEDDIQEHSEFIGTSYLSSASIRKLHRDGDPSGLMFESSASEGAILTMPIGSNSEDLGNITLFRKYATQHAEDWYKYVNNVRGREARNGDIRLVTGYDKTSAWGMATFSNSTAQNDSLYLTFRPTDQNTIGKTYTWDYSGMAEVRNGPDPRELEALQRDVPSREGTTYENQCLFVRTLNVKLQERIWRMTASEFAQVDVKGGFSYDSSYLHETSYANGMTNAGSSSTPLQSTNDRMYNPGACTPLSPPQQTNPESPSAYISPPTFALTCHPSDTLNDILLKLDPRARVAVTDDQDWTVLMKPDDTTLPSKKELVERVTSFFFFRQEEGILSLVRREAEDPTSKVSYSPQEPQERSLEGNEPESLAKAYLGSKTHGNIIPEHNNVERRDVFQSIVKGSKRRKTLYGDEVVWPPELVAALIEGLENYVPDDSGETQLLGHFPLRNGFISDWIFEKTGKRRTALEVGSHLQELFPPIHSNRFISPINVVNTLHTRSGQQGGAQDIDEAVLFHRQALELVPSSHPNHSVCLNNLADALQTRSELRGDTKDLDEAILFHRQALELVPSSHPNHSMCLNNLANALQTRFEQRGDAQDLDEAVSFHRQALAILPPTHPDLSTSLNNIANALHARFGRQHEAQDLDEAVSFHRQALELFLPPHPNCSLSMNNLANTLRTRFEQRGGVEDLEEAILLYRQAVVHLPSSHPNRSMSLNNLGSALQTRLELQGDTKDLDEAISVHRQVLEILHPIHPYRSISLNNLGSALRTRFERQGNAQDIDEAILIHRQALKFFPSPHPNRSMSLNNLANALNTRFEQGGDAQDIDEAILLHRQVLELRPSPHPKRSISLNNLGSALQTRFEQRGDAQDLDEAVLLYRQALEHPPTHPNHPMSLNLNLGNALQTQFEQRGDAQDLDEGISFCRRALELSLPLHPNHSMSLSPDLPSPLKSKIYC